MHYIFNREYSQKFYGYKMMRWRLLAHCSKVAMRQGSYEVQVLSEDGRVLSETTVDGGPVLEAEHGLTYRVKIRVHPDSNGAFPAELLFVRLYVDGHYAEWCRLTPKQGGAAVEQLFTGFRKNLHEKVAYVFALPELNALHASVGKDGSGGTLQVVFNRAHATGRIGEAPWEVTVPTSTASAADGVKFWKQPSVVTQAGKRLESKLQEHCHEWNLGEKLTTLTLPYHSSDTIAFLQQFHEAQKQREILAQAARDTRQGAPTAVIDLSDDTTEAEIKAELQQDPTNAPVDLTVAGNSQRGNVEVVDLFTTEAVTGVVDLTGAETSNKRTAKGSRLKRRRNDV
jgi:hypothetical protein